jgi:sugar phosphate isomerase/epimerase
MNLGSIPVAVQMYTLREASENDFVGTLKRVAEIGYEGVELAGFAGFNAKELKKIINDLGLCVASSHVKLEILEEELEKMIDYQKELGSQHIVCPSLPPERRNNFEEYKKLIDFLNYAGEKCKNAGITLSYHNHDFDLIRFEGKPALQILLEETNPEWVKVEFDVYWLEKAGENSIDWIKRFAGRTPLIHLKDMTTDDKKFFAELGTGGIDLKRVIEQGRNSNVEWWIVEQDYCNRSAFESIIISLNYLKENQLI